MSDRPLTCWSCRHSRHAGMRASEWLKCALTGGPAIRKCARYEYEPGTDEVERND